MASWAERQAEIGRIAACQMFFVGGAPRSGTTWLARILDSHPEISCKGEGLFGRFLAEPLDALIAQRREGLAEKNTSVFREAGGYPLLAEGDADLLLGTAILAALERQSAGKPCRAIGEKTPENVFLFPRLKAVFPQAKFIGIARDPRDVLTSAWYFFHKATPGEDEAAAKTTFLRSALPSIGAGARAMLGLGERYPGDALIVTYEALSQRPEMVVAALFDFLGMPNDAALVRDCVAHTGFAAMTGGRLAGVEQAGSFFRKGVAGDWRSTLTPAMNALVLQELGWMFPHFSWTP